MWLPILKTPPITTHPYQGQQTFRSSTLFLQILKKYDDWKIIPLREAEEQNKMDWNNEIKDKETGNQDFGQQKRIAS